MGCTANRVALVSVFLICKLGQKGSLTAQCASDSLQPSLSVPFGPRKLHFSGCLTRWPLLGMASGRPGGKPEGGREGNSPVLYLLPVSASCISAVTGFLSRSASDRQPRPHCPSSHLDLLTTVSASAGTPSLNPCYTLCSH